MQDFSIPINAHPDYEASITRRMSKEQLMASPMDMYLYSLAIRDRLPDDLHDAMLVWSFDPQHKTHVQNYILWAASCEERKKAKRDWERKMELHDIIMKGTMALAFLALVTQIAANLFLK